MKYGIYFAYWEKYWDADQVKYIKKVKDLGFDILEVSGALLKNNSRERLKEIGEMAKAEGVMLTCGYGPNWKEDLGSADEEIRKNAVAVYTDLLEKMQIMDIHTFGGGIYSYWPVDYSKPIDKEGDWARSVEGVRTVGRIAGDCGVDYCLEVLNRFEGYLINTCEECVKFVDEVGEPAVKVMLDTFHMNIEEDDMLKAIRLAGDKLGHFHVGENNRKVPGKGRFPWREIGRALQDIGYSKNVVMEPFVQMGGEVGSDIKVWRDISGGATGEQLDRDAKDSVAFLRYAFEGSGGKLW